MKTRRAFTLTELLVVLPVAALLGIGVLASLGNAEQKVQSVACLANMRQWGLAFALYANDHNDYVTYLGTPSTPVDQSFNLGAWYNVLAPYLRQPALKDLYAAGPSRIPVPGSRSVFVCPSSPSISYSPSSANPYFSYAMNRVLNGNFPSPPGLGLYKRSVAALPAQVVWLSESENDPYSSFSFTDGYYLGQTPPRHYGGDNFVFVDGHAEWEPLAAYKWNSPNITEVGEWISPRQVYWNPCRTCGKK